MVSSGIDRSMDGQPVDLVLVLVGGREIRQDNRRPRHWTTGLFRSGDWLVLLI
jgi:hypothetical protein